MTFLQRFSHRFHTAMTRRAAIRTLEHLRHLDDDILKSVGISPALLAKGPAFYPWREELAPAALQQVEVRTIVAVSQPADDLIESVRQAAA